MSRPEFMVADPQAEALAKQIKALDAEERRLKHREVLPLMATVAALVPEAMAGLIPKPKRFDCPKCRRAQLQRSRAMSYCLRCSYTEKT